MIYLFDGYSLDTSKFVIAKDGQNISCEPKVFNLILCLIENRDRLVTRDELFQKIWAGRSVSDTSLSNHIKSARKVLADDGQAQRVIKTVHGRGYQFIAKLSQEQPSPVNNQSTRSTKRRFILGVITFCLLSLVVSVWFLINKKEPNNYLLAVLPFTNTKPDKNSDYLGMALADRVINQLTYNSAINVRSSTLIRKYSGQRVDIKKVADSLNVEYVLTGYYLNIDNRIRLNVELLEASSHKLVWRSGAIEVDYKDAFELQDLVANSVLKGLEPNFPSATKSKVNKNNGVNVSAFELYLRSIAQPFSQSGHIEAISLLKESIKLDSEYAPVYVQLGNRIRSVEQFALINTGESYETVEYYKKALSINPNLLSAMSHLAFVYTETNRINEAMELAIRMLKINPNNAQTRFTLGYIFRYAGLNDYALIEMEKALELDPKNIMFRSVVSVYSGMNQHEKALKQLENYPDSAFKYGWKGILLLKLGNTQKALDYFNTVISDSPNGLWALVAKVHKAKLDGSIEQGLVAVHKLEQTNIADSETVFYNALYYCMLGDEARCIQSYKKAVSAGYYNTMHIDQGPSMDSVKNNPEFASLYQLAKNRSNKFKQQYASFLAKLTSN
ncbi:winged helix-turn-helix domain-containing protein [Paraglaciecola sp.]|uniref:winged helix-turn-helix domain-containing protein n=1 Tax=Paraglaciecola sp. TaxID=1920173 RepID=UPI0032663C23